MASSSTLTTAEVRLIKAMLLLVPRPSKQSILSYFTKPSRDINHRVITEIERGLIYSHISTASIHEVRAFMSAMRAAPRPIASHFLDPDSESAPQVNPTYLGDLYLDWWPVGQGLFSTGAIIMPNAAPITWIYDCGTSSQRVLLNNAIELYKKRANTLKDLAVNLAVLSHFDTDHINGFVERVKNREILTVMLPYVPLWQRLIIAIESGVAATDELFEFYLNPVAFLRNVEGSQIGEIVFVPPVGPDDLPPAEPEVSGPFPEAGVDGKLKLDVGTRPPEANDDPAAADHQTIRVRFLRKGGRLTISNFWEFVPYNDLKMKSKANLAFTDTLRPLIDSLRTDTLSRTTTLVSLKIHYDNTFGSSSENRNLISLFLYSGPIGNKISIKTPLSSHKNGLEQNTDRFSQMYTGDGNLETERFDQFERFFQPARRLERSGIFQVMHHGSKKSWHKGIAAKTTPLVSIFSSDPANGKYHHPDAEVLRDFWPYYSTQVDRKNGFHLSAILEAK